MSGFKKVQKVVKPVKILIYGATASGKTYGALDMAAGIVMAKRKCELKDAWKHIVLEDTEYGRGALYSKKGDYCYEQMNAPFTLQKLNNFINNVNLDDDIDVAILDSYTHFYSKKGGLLDQKLEKDKLGGNSYTNWNGLTQEFNDSLDTLLASPKVIICTCRAKSDTVLVDNGSGKVAPKTYGLKPDTRDGLDFEFDLVINVDKDTHNILLDKYLPGMEVAYDAITPEFGSMIYQLQNNDAIDYTQTKEGLDSSIMNLAKQNKEYITFVQLQLNGKKLNSIDIPATQKLLKDLIAFVKKQQADKKVRN